MSGPRRLPPICRPLFALVAAAALCGCGMMSDDTGISMMTVSGKFREYTCSDIAIAMKNARKREDELAQLIARAEQGTGGGAIGAVAYRTDYLQAKADQKLLMEAAGNKNCASDSKWTSERSLF